MAHNRRTAKSTAEEKKKNEEEEQERIQKTQRKQICDAVPVKNFYRYRIRILSHTLVPRLAADFVKTSSCTLPQASSIFR
jgi:hypothetical protein